MLPYGSGQAGKACLRNTLRALIRDSNMKLALVVVLISINTMFCFLRTLQWLQPHEWSALLFLFHTHNSLFFLASGGP